MVVYDLNIQCGQSTFVVAYPNGLNLSSEDDSDDNSGLQWWLVLVIVLGVVFVIATPAFVYYWRKRKSKEGLLNKALLGDYR